MLPEWDGGAFFRPIVRLLTKSGFSVFVVDALAPWDESVSGFPEMVARWRTLLSAFRPFNLLCGNAFGGALAQALLPSVAPSTAALLVSGPGRTDPDLDRRLEAIASATESHGLHRGLSLLAEYVGPDGVSTQPPETTGFTGDRGHDCAARRLSAGMRLLRHVDVTDCVGNHPGPVLNVVGARSLLVGPRHVAASASARHRVFVEPDSGMRPHLHRSETVAAAVRRFLREEGLL
ncbi:alpha/beta fold hydrolase [Prauserella shujinwangii]|uniref:alpha/beta fold hydrolase n=1 Tax=Prauserella shujinwangii TaxID=1453103 RepID=UPI0011B2045F|nr:hypothetical protein [Prauserella shujinwangii]